MGKGRTPVVETPAFKKAVADSATAIAEKMVNERMQALEERLAALTGMPGTLGAPVGEDGKTLDVVGQLLKKLSVDMQAIAGQGERRKPLTAEELLKREQGFQRLTELVEKAKQAPQDERPTYRVVSKIYFNERFIEPYRKVGQTQQNNEIVWTGCPNGALEPSNEFAREVFRAWAQSTGGMPDLVPTADRRPLYMTPNGLTVKGDPPKRQHVAAEPNFENDVFFRNDDPQAPEVAVLGTVAPKARQNIVQGIEPPRGA